jgi:putative Ca2+/H+ antiporter (TMEM165/GDT1 family)
MSLTFKGNCEFSQLGWETSHDVLGSADVKALPGASGTSERAPLDVVAVIDRSGSMSGELHLVKQTLKFMISKLGDHDQLSIVAFGSRATVELELTKMTATGMSHHYISRQ